MLTSAMRFSEIFDRLADYVRESLTPATELILPDGPNRLRDHVTQVFAGSFIPQPEAGDPYHGLLSESFEPNHTERFDCTNNTCTSPVTAFYAPRRRLCWTHMVNEVLGGHRAYTLHLVGRVLAVSRHADHGHVIDLVRIPTPGDPDAGPQLTLTLARNGAVAEVWQGNFCSFISLSFTAGYSPETVGYLNPYDQRFVISPPEHINRARTAVVDAFNQLIAP